jgi:hypothetical protein
VCGILGLSFTAAGSVFSALAVHILQDTEDLVVGGILGLGFTAANSVFSALAVHILQQTEDLVVGDPDKLWPAMGGRLRFKALRGATKRFG